MSLRQQENPEVIQAKAAQRFIGGAEIQHSREDHPETTTAVYDTLYKAIFEDGNPPAIALRAKALAEALLGRPVTFIELLADDELKQQLFSRLQKQTESDLQETKNPALSWLQKLLTEDQTKSPARQAGFEKCYSKDYFPQPKPNEKVLYMFMLYYWFKKNTGETGFDSNWPKKYLIDAITHFNYGILKVIKGKSHAGLLKEFFTLVINQHFMIFDQIDTTSALYALRQIEDKLLEISGQLSINDLAQRIETERKYLCDKFLTSIPKPNNIKDYEHAVAVLKLFGGTRSEIKYGTAAYTQLEEEQKVYTARLLVFAEKTFPDAETRILEVSKVDLIPYLGKEARSTIGIWLEKQATTYIEKERKEPKFRGLSAVKKISALNCRYSKAKEMLARFQKEFIAGAITETVSEQATDEQNANALKALSKYMLFISEDSYSELGLAQEPYIVNWLAQIDLSMQDSPAKIESFRKVAGVAIHKNGELVEKCIACSTKQVPNNLIY